MNNSQLSGAQYAERSSARFSPRRGRFTSKFQCVRNRAYVPYRTRETRNGVFDRSNLQKTTKQSRDTTPKRWGHRARGRWPARVRLHALWVYTSVLRVRVLCIALPVSLSVTRS